MLIKTKGLVFQVYKYGETSVIAEIYTEARGVQKYAISGVRSKKARVHASLLQPMSQLDLVVYAREDRDLNRVKEIRPHHLYSQIPFDVLRGAVGLFMIEVARKAIRGSEADSNLFGFLCESFLLLDSSSNSLANFPLFFLCRLSVHLGFCPEGVADANTPCFDLQAGSFLPQGQEGPHTLNTTHSKLLSQLLHTNTSNVFSINMSRDDRRFLLERMLEFYRLQLEYFPKINAHQILAEVLL